MNKDLLVERDNIDFNSHVLSVLLYGSEEELKKSKQFNDIVDTYQPLQDPYDVTFMTREKRYENAMRKSIEIMRYAEKAEFSSVMDLQIFRHHVMDIETSPLELHYIMFLPTLQGQATDDQLAKWLPLALSHRIVGTYAQTELGHGSNLRNLETTATYESSSDSFILHSPTLTSIKWWPGNLGKSTNYALVQAQLWIKDKCYGAHLFLVQLRDFDTHNPMPGITVGDIGPKFGMNSNDNGFLRFNQVRVPRENMLMRFAKVDRHGTYFPPSHDKLNYGGMLFVRAVMIMDLARCLAKATTIAIRYSCVRRQGELQLGKGEVKLLDYQTQQYKLFPQLANVYAFWFAGQYIRKMYFQISVDIRQGNTELLPELHAVASGLKAFVSYESARGIEHCRLCCGGHGFSQASGLPELYAYVVAACTYEGDNTVMFGQVARYLVKAYRESNAIGISRPTASYLTAPSHNTSQLDHSLQLDHLLAAYQHVAKRLISNCVTCLDKLNLSPELAWNNCLVQLTAAAKAHVHAFILQTFIDTVSSIEDNSVKIVMTEQCQLYALYGIYRRAGKFMQDGYLSESQLALVRQQLLHLLTEIRRRAVCLVDAFDFSDRILHSVLGRYDGNVYENLLKWAQSSPFNQKEVMDCHRQYLGQVIKDAKSKL